MRKEGEKNEAEQGEGEKSWTGRGARVRKVEVRDEKNCQASSEREPGKEIKTEW